MAKVSSEDILHGPIVWTMFRLGWPAMVTGILQTLYNLADAFWIGHLPPAESGAAVAAIQISWPIVWLLISFVAGFGGAAGSALISQYTGAKRSEEANFATSQIFSLSLLSGVVIGIGGFFFSPYLLPLLVRAGEVTDAATLYIRVIFLGMPFLFTPFLLYFALAAYGDTITPMIVNGGAVLLNVVLDPLLIFGLGPLPRLGIFGAALATVISQGVASIAALAILFRGKRGLKLQIRYFRPQMAWMRKIMGIGLPAAVGQSGTALGFVVLMAIIGRVANATVALAAYGIGDRVFSLLFIATEGLGVGLTTILGQSLGADLIQRAWGVAKKGAAVMFSVLVIEAALIWLARQPLMAFFIPGREDIIAEGVNFISIFVLAMPFFGLFSAVGAIFRGSGHNVPTMIMELSRLWALRVPLSYVFAFTLGMGSTGVWVGMTISNFAAALIAIGLFATGIWKEKVIEEQVPVVEEE
ncbi:MAG: MATE family efflux transporter [Candidatus Bipolaricaulia bacterium]